ncbi:hypothetical protein AAFF_G00225350 [Aldrovandia affinis]|uniref:PHD and RING finger domain-containing protein 1 n=1 Tax=Aldrovandia affinis TaxID=143900 RepID=A0AAD7TB30_9TELE|nr:hypothetical protein AAFF_G00225350 [Aldrovandia affinis]
MDEQNSQDELVNRSTSHERGRWHMSVLTDGENSADEGGDDSEGSDGSREDDEVEEDEDEEDSDDGEEGAVKGVEGAMAQLEDLSSDDDAEKCPICLHSFQEQPVVTPAGCQHHFCLDCLLEWSKNANSCPIDRIAFNSIYLRKCYGGKVQKTIPVQEPVKMEEEEEEINMDFDQTSCEVCGRSDRDDRLLLCDGCDAGYHMECLTPPLDAVPVEEWFCPECTANNPRTDTTEEVSEDEVEALLADAIPTTSRLRTSTAGRMRSIARTRQSERVRATVNRNRITQAHAIQTTWLDETINAVLNSAACAHSVTSRTGTSRNRRTDEKHGKKRKKERKKSYSSSSSKDRTAGQDIKTHRGHIKRAKPGQKQVTKKDPAPRSCFTKSLGTGKPKLGPSRPSGYCPEIRPRSLSMDGDPFDLDPFDDESRAAEGSLPQMDLRRRGLSHSALRSHQPVARPIQHSLSSHSLRIPEGGIMENTAPVPDLLGSILSGQSLLLMDSSDMVINRDGSLMLGKPACTLSSKTSISSNSNTELETEVHVGMETGFGLNAFQTSRDAGPSHTLPLRLSSSQSSPNHSSSPAKSTSPLTPPIVLGNANVCSPNPVPQRPSNVGAPNPINPVGLSQRSWSKTIDSSHSFPLKNTNSTSEWASKEMGTETGLGTGAVKKAPPKPVWFDVSGLPRIPKIRRGTNSSSLDSYHSSQQGAPQGEQGRAEAGWRQSYDRAGTSSSASSCTSTVNPTSSSTVSFCISASRSAWHTRCHTSPEVHGTTLGSVEDKDWEKRRTNMYDPFHPTESDSHSSDAASESDDVGCRSKYVITISRPPAKRVTWNLQEVDISPAKPTGMLPFNTLKQSSRDGHHTPASQNMKKLHLQKRAIEEVKLAIKPFFLKKEITKEEYKEIWGKAVQKVCHSKSGEISPEKVANLVKAYVEKYKLAKKHQKGGGAKSWRGTL